MEMAMEPWKREQMPNRDLEGNNICIYTKRVPKRDFDMKRMPNRVSIYVYKEVPNWGPEYERPIKIQKDCKTQLGYPTGEKKRNNNIKCGRKPNRE